MMDRERYSCQCSSLDLNHDILKVETIKRVFVDDIHHCSKETEYMMYLLVNSISMEDLLRLLL
jgi:Holliday junction resolvasome RuvABC ATP-dependent DNA helicase subunit